MKAFPHQFASLSKLLAAARVLIAMDEDGAPVNDSTYGEALARSGIYTFKGGGNVEDRIAAERLKNPSNQGFRTAARDLRRTLTLLGIVKTDGAATVTGNTLIAANTPELAQEVWRSALLNMALASPTGVSHPYRILLRLAADNPGIEVRKLMLAFEAQDDSESEYIRILNLANLPFEEILITANISEASAANAVKILPSISFQLGDLVRTNNARAYPAAIDLLTGVDEAGLKLAASRTTTDKKPLLGQALTPEQVAPQPNFGASAPTFADLSAGIEIRKQRTREHQSLVYEFASALQGRGFSLYAGVYDCLAIKPDRALLIEAKTLDGSPSDERTQSEKAVGQLAGYLHFDLPQELDGQAVQKVAIFSRQPSEPTIAFLSALDIDAVWAGDGEWRTSAPNVAGAPYGF